MGEVQFSPSRSVNKLGPQPRALAPRAREKSRIEDPLQIPPRQDKRADELGQANTPRFKNDLSSNHSNA